MSIGHTFLSTELLTELKEKNAVVDLIDADIPAYSVAFKCENVLSWHLVEKEVDNFMMARIRETGATHFIGFLTNGGKNYRIKVATTAPYKGNRAGSERPKWYTKIREYLQKSWLCQVMQGIEADDALAIAHKYFRDNGIKCFLSTLDKDLRQSPGWHHNWKCKGQGSVCDYVDDDKAQRYLWRQVITGDMGTDNIPGLSECAWKPKLGFRQRIMESYKKVPSEPAMLKSGKFSTAEKVHMRTIGWETIDDPKRIKGLTDDTYGKTRAKELLPDSMPVEQYPAVVLEEYISAYWEQGEIEGYDDPADKGIERFNEVFALIYMLRTVDEIPNEAVIDFTPQEVQYQVFNEFDDDEDVLAEFDDDYDF